MKRYFESPIMEPIRLAVTDILCSSVGGGGGLAPDPTTVAPTTVPATTAAATRPSGGNGDDYKDDIF